MNIGEAITKRRLKLKLTQFELASKANISQTYLSQIECNLRNPTITVLCNIADSLNMEVYKLLK